MSRARDRTSGKGRACRPDQKTPDHGPAAEERIIGGRRGEEGDVERGTGAEERDRPPPGSGGPACRRSRAAPPIAAGARSGRVSGMKPGSRAGLARRSPAETPKGGPSGSAGPDPKRGDDAVRILEAGLAAAMPSGILPRILRRRSIVIGKSVIRTTGYSSVRLVSFGKAGLSMATAFDGRIRARDGIVVIPRDVPVPKRSRFRIIRSTHPNPSADSVRAAKAILSYVRGCQRTDLIVFLVSGGGSALVSLPDGITLEEKARTNDLLLRSGADIGEVNCVRKHLSAIKGGRMVSDLPCEAVALLMSDVKGNDMSAIASGATYCDGTTFARALGIVKRYGLDPEVPPGVLAHLRAGAKGRIPETPKRPAIRNFVVASNKNCLAAMKKRAEKLGYGTETATVFGRIEKQAGILARMAPARRGSCLIFGGETTVRVMGRGGRGGRNQEMVLRVAGMVRRRDLIVGSIGTDGIDGNTGFAGAMTHASNVDRTEARRYLKTSNSGAYFERYGGLIETGPTQTNLLDIGIILC